MPVTIGGSGPITGVTSINTSVSDTELGYLDGVSSALQTQINAKANDSSQGLYLITPTSIANSGGSASASGGAVTFTTVNSVSLNGVFNSTYKNYRTFINIKASNAGQLLQVRFRVNGSDNTASSYLTANIGLTTGQAAANIAGSSTEGNLTYLNTEEQGMGLDVSNPFETLRTSMFGNGVFVNSGAAAYATFCIGVLHDSATSFDGFTLRVASGTITGTVRVYGYKN